MRNIIQLEDAFIGDDYPCFIIGEIGSNHNRDKSTVRKVAKLARIKLDDQSSEERLKEELNKLDKH